VEAVSALTSTSDFSPFHDEFSTPRAERERRVSASFAAGVVVIALGVLAEVL
jgi:hypothetical protein